MGNCQLEKSCWKDIKEVKYDIVVLPWGATEPHNYHLSYCTDSLLAESISCDAAELAGKCGVNVMVLPSIPLGSQNPGQHDYPFCIHASYETQKAILTDVVCSLERQGFNKLVIVNGHGGNSFKAMIRDISFHYPHFFIAVVDWFSVLPQKEYFENPDDHAGELETSAMLYYYPDRTDISKAGKGESVSFQIEELIDGTAWAPRIWNKASQDTGIGNPALATSEKGECFVKDVVAKIANLFVSLAKSSLYK